MSPPEGMAVFKERLNTIIDKIGVIDDPSILEEYSNDLSFVKGNVPDLMVSPTNKEEVQDIVRLANKYKVPLIPVSSDPPRFYGDTVPVHGGVIINFKQMNRIINIDPVNRYARIEPGVTYGELLPELEKQDLKLCMPLLPRSSKSVVTSRLERQPTLIPKYQYDYIDPLLTLEVIYGTGDDFRTGSASGPGPYETLKADKVNPWGPGCVDYFRFLSGAQGTMGIVTWATVKTEVMPVIQKIYFIPINEHKDLSAPMIQLLRKRVVDECLALNNVNLSTILADSWPDDFYSLKDSLPPWTIIVCISGYKRRPEERIVIQEKYLQNICNELGLKATTELPGVAGSEEKIRTLLSSAWNSEPYWKLRQKGSSQDVFFLSQLTKVQDNIRIMEEVIKRYKYPLDNPGVYIQPTVQGRGCHCEFNFPFDKDNDREKSEIKKMYTEISQALLENGAFFSRPYGPWADMVYSHYPEGVSALRKLKDIFDPNNILNPGKLCF